MSIKSLIMRRPDWRTLETGVLPGLVMLTSSFALAPIPAHAATAASILVAGGDYSYPPYEFIDNSGRPAGFNVDLMRAIAAEENLNVAFRLGPWKKRRHLLETGKIAVLAMFVSAERDQSFDFSKPFLYVNHALFVRRGDAVSPQSLRDLNGLQVLVETGSYADDLLAHSASSMTLVQVRSEYAAMRLLAAGRYDVAVLGGLRGRLMLEDPAFSDVTTSGPPLLPAQYAFAVTEGNEALLRKINHGLQQVKQSGEFDRLYNKWIAQNPDEFNWRRLVHIGIWAGLATLAAALLATLWIYTLKRQVRVRTRALKSSEEQFRATFENAGVGMAWVTPDLRCQQANASLARMLGISLDSLKQKSLRHILNREDVHHLFDESRRLIDGQADSFSVQCGFTNFEGQAGWANVVVTIMREVDGTPGGFIVVVENRSETQRLAAQLDYQGRHDVLTGLQNRHALSKKLYPLMRPGAVTREHALCFLDIDQFKVINGTCGHDAGDAFLLKVASEMHRAVGHEGILARLGGDKFGLLVENCATEKALDFAHAMRDSVSRTEFDWNGHFFRRGASVGVVPFNNQSELPEGVLAAADIACTVAKDKGGNQIHVFVLEDSEIARHHSELRWVSRLGAAMDNNHFELYYQPIIPLRGETKKLHYEILLRYRDSHDKIVAPGQFIPAAERYLVMESLDRWVVRSVLEWLQSHPRHCEQLDLCAINLSGQSIGNPGFHEFLEHALDDYDVPARKLCIEITETAAIANIGNASAFARRLKSRGCHLALDDFGIGMSSFAYLKSFPVDFLKIDGSFVREIGNNTLDRAVVHSIAEVGHAMGMKTIAEFVETREILQQVNEMGLDYAQGFYFARPQPLNELIRTDPVKLSLVR
ncbi:MAG TPA: EAL domain-containing protein [Gammaproteobacteria bacterium]|nr:EAL domain-containing protein [Gammaproteobacteria bacterium]